MHCRLHSAYSSERYPATVCIYACQNYRHAQNAVYMVRGESRGQHFSVHSPECLMRDVCLAAHASAAALPKGAEALWTTILRAVSARGASAPQM